MNEHRFNKYFVGEFAITERDEKLYEFAKEYHSLCEEYDKTVCSFENECGVALPCDVRELVLINKNARKVKQRLTKEYTDYGFSDDEMRKAINSFRYDS